MPKQVKPGDIIEIPTSKGFAYAQYVQKEKQWGALLRVLPGYYQARPALGQIVIDPERFVVFFPLQAAVNRGIFNVVAHEEIPEESKDLPLFRVAGFIDRGGRVGEWWLWDKGRESKLGKLTDETKKLPILEVWNDTLLVQRIEEGWTPQGDSRS